MSATARGSERAARQFLHTAQPVTDGVGVHEQAPRRVGGRARGGEPVFQGAQEPGPLRDRKVEQRPQYHLHQVRGLGGRGGDDHGQRVVVEAGHAGSGAFEAGEGEPGEAQGLGRVPQGVEARTEAHSGAGPAEDAQAGCFRGRRREGDQGELLVRKEPPGGGQVRPAQRRLRTGEGLLAGCARPRRRDGVRAVLGQLQLAGGLPQRAVGDDAGEQRLHQGGAPRLPL